MARSDTIRVANARELATVREEGERAIANLHAQLAEQWIEIEHSVETVGIELASLTSECDAVRAELERFAAPSDRLGIRLIETRTQPVIVVPRGRKFASRARRACMNWPAAMAGCIGLHALRYRGVQELAWRGCEDDEIATYSGHATKEMIEKYAGEARQIMRALQAREKRQ